MNGKTIRQIAEELGVSKQAVHQKRKQPSMSTALQPFTSTVNGTVYISEEGVTILKRAFSENGNEAVADKFTESVNKQNDDLLSVLTRTVELLQEQLKAKDSQIKAKDEQIMALTAALESTTASLQAAQALHAGTLQQLPDPGRRRWPWTRKADPG